jgi:dolichyl-phosphate beta-glucosyltransferase
MTETGGVPHLTLVVPCYNGEDRLAAALQQLSAFLALQSYSSELILVDDCSAEPAARILRDFAAARPGVTLIRNERNLGKGTSVARGILAGRGRFRVFTDADLAYPPEEINKILRDLESGADMAIACRVLPESRYLMSPSFFHYLYTRHVMSRMFNLLTRALLLRDVLIRRPDSRASRRRRPRRYFRGDDSAVRIRCGGVVHRAHPACGRPQCTSGTTRNHHRDPRPIGDHDGRDWFKAAERFSQEIRLRSDDPWTYERGHGIVSRPAHATADQRDDFDHTPAGIRSARGRK